MSWLMYFVWPAHLEEKLICWFFNNGNYKLLDIVKNKASLLFPLLGDYLWIQSQVKMGQTMFSPMYKLAYIGPIRKDFWPIHCQNCRAHYFQPIRSILWVPLLFIVKMVWSLSCHMWVVRGIISYNPTFVYRPTPNTLCLHVGMFITHALKFTLQTHHIDPPPPKSWICNIMNIFIIEQTMRKIIK